MMAFLLRGPSPMKSWSPTTSPSRKDVSVHGERGLDPTEPPYSAPYPYPPVSHEPRIQQLYDNLQKANYHPFPAPCAILLNEKDILHSRCIRCQTCDGFPCLVQAKADAEMVRSSSSLDFPNVTLLTKAKAINFQYRPLRKHGE